MLLKTFDRLFLNILSSYRHNYYYNQPVAHWSKFSGRCNNDFTMKRCAGFVTMSKNQITTNSFSGRKICYTSIDRQVLQRSSPVSSTVSVEQGRESSEVDNNADISVSCIRQERQIVTILREYLSDNDGHDCRVSDQKCQELRNELFREAQKNSGQMSKGSGSGAMGGAPTLLIPRRIDSQVLHAVLLNKLYGLGASYLMYLLRKDLYNPATVVQACEIAFKAWSDDLFTSEEAEQLLVYMDEKFGELFKVSPLHRNYVATITPRYKQMAETLMTSETKSISYHVMLVCCCFKHGETRLAFDLLRSLADSEKITVSEFGYNFAYLCESVMKCALHKMKQNQANDALQIFRNFVDFVFRTKMSGLPAKLESQIREIFSGLNPVWNVEDVEIYKNGTCSHCGTKLVEENLTENEFIKMRTAVMNDLMFGKDVFRSSTPEEMIAFQKMLAINKPFDVVFDALNVAMYRTGRLSSPKVRVQNLINKIDHLKQQYNFKKACVIGRRHLFEGCPVEMGILRRIACVVSLDNATVDDPFTLYAALSSGAKCYVVSADQFSFLSRDVGLKEAQIFKRWLRCRLIGLFNEAGYSESILPNDHALLCQNDMGGYHVPLIPKPKEPVRWICIRRPERNKSFLNL